MSPETKKKKVLCVSPTSGATQEDKRDQIAVGQDDVIVSDISPWLLSTWSFSLVYVMKSKVWES